MFFGLMYIFIVPRICRLFNRKKNDLDISDFRSFYQTMFQLVSLLRSEIMVHGKGKVPVEAADRNP